MSHNLFAIISQNFMIKSRRTGQNKKQILHRQDEDNEKTKTYNNYKNEAHKRYKEMLHKNLSKSCLQFLTWTFPLLKFLFTVA